MAVPRALCRLRLSVLVLGVGLAGRGTRGRAKGKSSVVTEIW